MTTLPSLIVAGLALLAGPLRSPDPTLDRLLACHDRAMGGAALRAVNRIEYHLAIEEPGMSLRGRYRAVREGIGGRMRIDVFSDSTRVYSEWWDGRRAWQLAEGADAPAESRVDGAEALRHGLEQPGHLWTLADMPANGHTVKLAGRDFIAGTLYHVVQLTLSDGFTNWYWVHPGTCRIERSRNFRSFHPDQDPGRRWLEAAFDHFRSIDGVTRAFRERTVDLSTGAVVGTTRILAVRLDPPFEPHAVSPAPAPR
jgi:hypothetical protein